MPGRYIACGLALLLNFFVFRDFTVSNENDAVRVQGDIVFVSNKHDSIALLVQPLEQRHDFVAGRGVEVAGRLVGE